MNKPNVSKLFKNVQQIMARRSPEILIGIGIAGMITTTVLAVKATPKAIQLIEAEKQRKNKDSTVEFDEAKSTYRGHSKQPYCCKLTPFEVVKTTWKCYFPAVSTGVISVACLIGAQSVNARRNAALATAYRLSETAFAEYKDKVVETIGEKKEQVIKDKITQDKLEKNPVSSNEVIMTEKGNTLCYDPLSARYFKSDIDQLKRVECALNEIMFITDYISVNDLYDELGLAHISIGDDLGWCLHRDGKVSFRFSARVADDGRPCLVLDYWAAPKYGYSEYM